MELGAVFQLKTATLIGFNDIPLVESEVRQHGWYWAQRSETSRIDERFQVSGGHLVPASMAVNMVLLTFWNRQQD